MKTAALLLFLAVATVSGYDSLQRTGGFINGREWRAIPHQQKLGFVLGFSEGVKVPAIGNDKEKKALAAASAKVFLGESQFGEIVAGVDDFYSDPANLQIQVIVAMQYFQEKVNGASPESLARDLADYRKFSAENVDH